MSSRALAPRAGRQRTWLALEVAGASLLAAACVPVDPLQVEMPGSVGQGIINGELDELDRSVVALVADGRMFCTGTVIAPRAVLTAGHCLMDTGIAPRAMAVYFGTTVGSGGRTIRVVAGRVHPGYYVRGDNAPINDVAVLQLAEEAPAPPVAWQRTPLADLRGKLVTLVGYGVTDAERQSGYGTRRAVRQLITGMDDAFIFYGPDLAGTCNGDSGGPMLLDVDGTPTLVGVTSWGDNSCVRLGGNTRTDPLASFVAEQAPLAPAAVALSFASPRDGAPVESDFGARVEASGAAPLAEVALYLDGVLVALRTEPPFAFELAFVPRGLHVIRAQAVAVDGGFGAADLTVEVTASGAGAGCRDDECPDGSTCEATAQGALCIPSAFAAGCQLGGHRRAPASSSLCAALLLVVLAAARRRRGTPRRG